MENRKLIKFLIPILLLGFFVVYNPVFAYSIETHASLTNEIVKFYNQNFPGNKIPDELKNYLIDGSRREDDIPRWMNHFYDPVYNRGLTDSVLGTWQKSKDWAQDSNNQNSLTYKVPATIASVLTAVQQQKISAISAETDFTWQKAIKFYVQGEKEKAMFILGHILHLIEDKSVPDHTRNDPHPGDSPYENWTERFTLNNPDKELSQRLNNDKPLVFTDLNSYFNELAKYSNNNFYSKDRIGIQTGYELPEPDYFKKDGIYFYGFKTDKGNSDYHLLAYKKPPSKYLWAFNEEITLKDEGQDFIVFDYWSRLSAKSVQYGAGVINLFLQEVEKAKNDPNFAKTEEKSIFAKALETAKNLLAQVGDFFSGSSDGFQPAGEISLNQSQDSSISGDQTSNIASQNIKQCSFNVSQSPSRQKVVINEIAWMGGVNSANDEWIELKNISNAAINLSGYQLIDQAEQIKIIFDSNDKIPANGFYLLEKTDDGAVPNIKADKIYTGQLSNTNEGLRLFDSNCNLIDEVFANPNWPAGDNQSKKTMERNSANFSWHTSSAIGGTPKKENSQPVLVKKQELSINLLEETEEDDEEIAPQQEQTQQATSSPQQTQQTATFKQCAFQTNQSSSRQKVIINEIAWMGMPPKAGETNTQASNNEWIELKNISGAEVNINGWQLIDQGEQIKINLGLLKETKIKPNQFLLLERTDDNTVPNITADLIYTGILSNSNEGLRLFDNQCNLIDEVFANQNWPAGDNTAKKTMERKSDFSWYTSSIVGGTPKKENSTPSAATTSGSSGGSGVTPTNNQQQSTSAKILISEVQITGGAGKADNDFIELYNPNNAPVDISGWKLRKRTQSGTESSIKVFGTRKSISGQGYFLWANSKNGFSETIQADESSTAILSENYSVALFDANDNLIDAVAWGSGHANLFEGSSYPTNPSANQSIQRKFQNNTFIDTDNNTSDFEIQTCPSPKTQSRDCSATNQAPSAFFVYTPLNLAVGETITFNAASSSDPDGQIISYQWDFGNNTTSSVSTATTTHTYSQVGNYQVSLIVFDNQNASSTATSTIISVSASGANHLVISEIQVRGDAADDEFIELYNPTNNAVSLSEYSIQYLSGTATSTEKIKKKNFSNDAQIPAKGFYLIVNSNATSSLVNKANMAHSSFSLSGDPIGATIFLVSTTISILSISDSAIVDSLSYGSPQLAVGAATSTVPDFNKSLERKAFYNGQCATASGSGEFLGNACDRNYDNDDDNNTTDFEIRNTPNPQNSQSLPEPRSAPTTPQSFTVEYSSSTMELIFNWSSSQDYSDATSTITYKITDISNTSSTLSNIETTLTTAKISINEIGRDYQFSIQALDGDRLGSTTNTASITVPSFFSGLYFYQNSRDNNKNLIEAYYNQYPFIPDLYYNPPNSSWKLLVFYLNSEAKKQSNIYTFPYQPNNLENVLTIKYKHCSGGSITQENSLLFPDIESRCGTGGGAMNITLDYPELEDSHFIIQTASSSQELNLTSNDFLTVAFYSTSWINVGPIPYFQLVVVDKIKYYFGNPPTHQPPQLSGEITLNFDKQNSRLNINWPKATDPDTLDSLLTYEIRYASSTNWGSVGNATGTARIVAPGDNFLISVRAKDDFDNYSTSSLTANWSYPETIFYVSQTEINDWSYRFGEKDGLGSVSVNLQSIIPDSDFQFNKVVLRVKQNMANDSANLRLSVYGDNGSLNRPDFNKQMDSTVISNIYQPDENSDITFSFSNPVSLATGNKYWLALDIKDYSWYLGWGRNNWQNAISSANFYSGGEAGRVEKNRDGIYGNVNFDGGNNDWYMKIGLEP